MIKHYTRAGNPAFPELLQVKERITDLEQTIGLKILSAIVMAEVTRFLNSYTVVRPMNATQIADCAMTLIATSEEDRLSLNDLVIFFEGAKQGKYGRVLDHIDQHVIFEMLEVYRQERHLVMIRHRQDEIMRHKEPYDTDRASLRTDKQEVDIQKAMWDLQEKFKTNQNDKA